MTTVPGRRRKLEVELADVATGPPETEERLD